MDPSRAGGAALWSWTESPVAFHLRERVLIFARPALRDGRAVVREHRLVLLGKAGSRIRFEDGEIVVEGVEANAGDVHPLGAARVEGDRLLLLGLGDGLFLRVKPRARGRILEIRIRGRGQGPLSVAEATFWTPPRVTTHQMQGTFSLRHRWEMVSSGGPDLAVSLGRGPGQARIESVSLVPPSDPEAPVILR
jgi:hypothetical protein